MLHQQYLHIPPILPANLKKYLFSFTNPCFVPLSIIPLGIKWKHRPSSMEQQ